MASSVLQSMSSQRPASARAPLLPPPSSPTALKAKHGAKARRSSSCERGPQEITLLLERYRQRPGAPAQLESVKVLAQDRIQDVRLKLRQLSGWFVPEKHALVLGDRTLMGDEVVGQLAEAHEDQASGPGILHVYVKLSDIDSLSLSTHLERQMFSRTAALQDSPRSALTAQLADSPVKAAAAAAAANEEPCTPKPTSLVLRGQLVDDRAVCIWPDTPSKRGATSSTQLATCAEAESNTAVVHLVIQRTAKVGWRNVQGGNFELSVSASDTADSIKQRLLEQGLPAASHHLLYNGQPLSSSRSLAEYGIAQGCVLELVPIEPCAPSSCGPKTPPCGSPLLSSPNHGLFQDWQKARAGLAKGMAPKLAPAGTGGSYFICDEHGTNVAVFKPLDEEPLAVNNPKGRDFSSDGHGLRRGIQPGEGAVREVAAFLLDHDHFAGVPPTAMVACQAQQRLPGTPTRNSSSQTAVIACDAMMASRTGMAVAAAAAGMPLACMDLSAKIGSLQQFVAADGDCEERGCSSFPVQEVHKICVLDMRLANTDRNGSNILVRRHGTSWQLIPIDHGYCLPSTFQDITFEWLYWPQAQVPFDATTSQYIESLDAQRDLEMLTAHGLVLRPECKRVMQVCTSLCKKGVRRGMTPYAIGSIMCREGLGQSPLEKLHSRAVRLALLEVYGQHNWAAFRADLDQMAVPDAVYLRHMDDCLDEYLDEACLEQKLEELAV